MEKSKGLLGPSTRTSILTDRLRPSPEAWRYFASIAVLSPWLKPSMSSGCNPPEPHGISNYREITRLDCPRRFFEQGSSTGQRFRAVEQKSVRLAGDVAFKEYSCSGCAVSRYHPCTNGSCFPCCGVIPSLRSQWSR